MKNFPFGTILLLSFIFIGPFESKAGKGEPVYKYQIDLSSVSNDQLKVEVSVPKISQNEIKFYMPKIIPGTYSIADYGRFVTDFKAFDKKGRELAVEQLDDNTWIIQTAKKRRKITYVVDDTYDTTIEGPSIFQPAGSNIEKDKNYDINPGGYFGYLEGMKNLGFEISITRPENFYGGTGLKTSSQKSNGSGKFTDLYLVDSYDRLIDSPWR